MDNISKGLAVIAGFEIASVFAAALADLHRVARTGHVQRDGLDAHRLLKLVKQPGRNTRLSGGKRYAVDIVSIGERGGSIGTSGAALVVTLGCSVKMATSSSGSR